MLVEDEPVAQQMPVATAAPLWTGGAEVARRLDAVLRLPLAHPELFDGEAAGGGLPLRRLVAVWAPAGSGKATAVRDYCEHVDVAYATVDATTEKVPATHHGGAGTVVIIVEHAERLATDEMHAQYALQLHRRAEHIGVILVCLFDTLLRSNEFLMQFDRANVYFPPPDSTFVAAYMKYWFTQFAARYHAEVVVQLDDGDYTAMGDVYARDVSPALMLEWVRYVFYEAVHEAHYGRTKGPVAISMRRLCGIPYMSDKAGRGDFYILPVSPHTVLNEFSCAAGAGPVHVQVAQRRAPDGFVAPEPPKKKKKRGLVETEGEPEADAKKPATAESVFFKDTAVETEAN